jgi:branched-chain amino acid transport system substrate-binding protein
MSKFTLAVLAAVSALALTAVAQAQQKEVTIAVVGPITGKEAPFGAQMKLGAEAAVRDLNAAGGVNGMQIKLVVEDDACDPKQAVTAANKVAGSKVAAVIGHYCSSSSIPASDVYWKAKIIQITPASTNPALTEDAAKKGWTNVHRVCGRDDNQGAVAGAFLAKTHKGKKIAILHDNTTYGKGLADETRKAFNKAGGKEAMYEAYKEKEKDYSAVVAKLQAAGIQVVYIGGYAPETALIARQAAEKNYKPIIMGGDALDTDDVLKVAGPAADNILFTQGPDPRMNPASKAVVDKFKAANQDPEGYTLYTYAAIQVWAQAVTKAKSTDMAKVSPVLRSGQAFNTVMGPIKLDKKGDVIGGGYVFWSFKGGKKAQSMGMN